MKETKPPVVNQQCVVCSFQCDLCDAGYVGYTRGHLHNRVKGHTLNPPPLPNTTKLFSVRDAFYKSLNAKSQRAIGLQSCESIFIIFAP